MNKDKIQKKTLNKKLGENIQEEDRELDWNDMIGKMSQRRKEGRKKKETEEEHFWKIYTLESHLTFSFDDPKSIISVLQLPLFKLFPV
jgi:mRNA-degrading endonuclease RelE of RelBE toxin-antitoxin system